MTGAFTFRMDPLDPGNIRLKSDMAGGSLLDVGCYPVYGIRWAFGAEPVRVWASARYLHGVDVEMTGVLWFADGRMATFDCGFTQPFRQWLEIVGAKARSSCKTCGCRRTGPSSRCVPVQRPSTSTPTLDTIKSST